MSEEVGAYYGEWDGCCAKIPGEVSPQSQVQRQRLVPEGVDDGVVRSVQLQKRGSAIRRERDRQNGDFSTRVDQKSNTGALVGDVKAILLYNPRVANRRDKRLGYQFPELEKVQGDLQFRANLPNFWW